jgi:hypothetical protein
MEPDHSFPYSQEPSSLNQMNPVHNTSSYFSKILSNIILPPTSGWAFLDVSFMLATPPHPYMR